MAKPQPATRSLESYTIKGSTKSIKPGDSVLLRSPEAGKPPYVARVESIQGDRHGAKVQVRVRWFYRPEESIFGRRSFHGAKELFLSDHYDLQSAETIEGRCVVHSFKDYTRFPSVGDDEYFYRFEYEAGKGALVPDRATVFCLCEMPYNPDVLMIQCEDCSEWYHTECVGLDAVAAKKIKHFFCNSCLKEKKAQNAKKTSRQSDLKKPAGETEPDDGVQVANKRQRK